jgi:hypothetical protein
VKKLLLFLAIFFFLKAPVYAATDFAALCRSDNNPTGCLSCLNTGTGVWTAVGCIQTDVGSFFSTVLKFGMGIAGGIAFLLILLGGFQILTSAGNPEQLNAGKELVGSAVTGLLLIIFSVFFLKIIGVDILGIPGWSV